MSCDRDENACNSSSSSRSSSGSLDLQDFKIPDCIFKAEGGADLHFIPNSPLLVFINTKSGGQLGSALLKTFRRLLSSHQVFDLNEVDPHQVLTELLKLVEAIEARNDEQLAGLATGVRKRLKLVVAGGDGTAGWLLGAASDLSLPSPIPVATIPLGTGNNLPFSFGWGKRNPGTDVQATKKFIKQVVAAHPLKVDRWQLILKIKGKAENLPPSMHLIQENVRTYSGEFWNYFSLGMDAQVSYQFHRERHNHPEKFNNQLRNQCAYAKLGCTQGWFCAACTRPSSKNINQIATLFTAQEDGPWKKLHISSSIRSLVLLNLPSFSGGLDPWGTPNDKKSVKRGLTSTSIEDGKLELVGFRDGWHGLFLLFPKGHGTRLAQAQRIKIEFKGAAEGSYAYLRMDGEPWRQALPEHDNGSSIEISHHGQGVMLAREGCIAERKDAYEHRLSITEHDLKHGLQLKHPQKL